MKFIETNLQGAYIITPDLFEDERGFFARCFCEHTFSEYGLETRWVQINNSVNHRKGTLRGLHFQWPPKAETKLVRCIQGAVWDVMVDLRAGSRTFGKWYGAELSETNRTMMYIPKGFAHGFVSLKGNSEILYFVSEFYSPAHEGSLRWDDSLHGILWPIKPMVISDKDKFVKDWEAQKAIEL